MAKDNNKLTREAAQKLLGKYEANLKSLAQLTQEPVNRTVRSDVDNILDALSNIAKGEMVKVRDGGYSDQHARLNTLVTHTNYDNESWRAKNTGNLQFNNLVQVFDEFKEEVEYGMTKKEVLSNTKEIMKGLLEKHSKDTNSVGFEAEFNNLLRLSVVGNKIPKSDLDEITKGAGTIFTQYKVVNNVVRDDAIMKFIDKFLAIFGFDTLSNFASNASEHLKESSKEVLGKYTAAAAQPKDTQEVIR